MVHGKSSLALLLFFLAFSYVLSYSAAVPATRSLKSIKEEPSSSLQELLTQDAVEEVFNVREEFIEGRMELENTDYPGTGANNHHDPKTPGRA